MPFRFSAMAQQRDGFTPGQCLQKAKGEFLAVVLDRAIAAVDGAVIGEKTDLVWITDRHEPRREVGGAAFGFSFFGFLTSFF
jgi:hypothetical protein